VNRRIRVQIAGQASVLAPPAEVFTALEDPLTLQRSLPRCQTLVRVEGGYRATFSLDGPAVRGVYHGDIRVCTRQAPQSLDFEISLAGAAGGVTATVQTRLEPSAEGTRVRYRAQAELGGALATFGRRALGGLVSLLCRQFFEGVCRETAP